MTKAEAAGIIAEVVEMLARPKKLSVRARAEAVEALSDVVG